MKKKFFIGIAMSLFAVATVFNMNLSEQNEAGDVSLDAIEVMAQAEAEFNACPGPMTWRCHYFSTGYCTMAYGCGMVCYGGC